MDDLGTAPAAAPLAGVQNASVQLLEVLCCAGSHLFWHTMSIVGVH